MRVAVNSHALPVYMKNRISSLLCIFAVDIFSKHSISFILQKIFGPVHDVMVFIACLSLTHLK